MKKFFLSILLLTFISSNLVNAQSIIPAKKDDIKKLIMIINNKAFESINDWLVYSITSSFKNLYPTTNDANLALAKDAAHKKLIEKQDSLLELIIPIYSAQFTHDEIRDILYFLDGNAGKKFIAVNTEILKTVQDITLEWGSEISREITEAAIIHIPEAFVEGESEDESIKKPEKDVVE